MDIDNFTRYIDDLSAQGMNSLIFQGTVETRGVARQIHVAVYLSTVAVEGRPSTKNLHAFVDHNRDSEGPDGTVIPDMEEITSDLNEARRWNGALTMTGRVSHLSVNPDNTATWNALVIPGIEPQIELFRADHSGILEPSRGVPGQRRPQRGTAGSSQQGQETSDTKPFRPREEYL